MKILTVTNLYPRPDEPQRGMFNGQQFRAMAASVTRNLCLVPEWRVWRWRNIRGWHDPYGVGLSTQYLPTFYLPKVGRNLSWRCYATALRAAEDVFREVDAVLATWLYPDAVAASILASEAKRPLWIKAHGSDRFHLRNRVRGREVRRACASAEGIICNCEFLADSLAELGVPKDKIHIVPNGVDTRLFRPIGRERARGELHEMDLWPLSEAAKTGKVVLFVGNLLPVKGPDVLLRAWRDVVASEGTARHLVIMGNGPIEGELRRQSRAAGVESSVTFVGAQSHDDVPLWMNAADCLCLPSRSEAMPNVILEALACGLPVVASDVGSCRELLAGEPESIVVPPESPSAMAEALADMLARDPDRTAMRERHARSLSWETSARQLLALMGRNG